MGFKRYGAKTDNNHSELLNLVREIPGVSVQDLGDVGEGCPDALLGYQGANLLIEIKRPDVAPSASKLNPLQVDWHYEWKGQVAVVRTLDDILAVLGIK